MKVSYNWLQAYLGEKLPEPHKLVELISVRAFEIEELQQVGNDWMIDVDVLPNRAHDCLSQRGIAKELSVILDIPFKDFLVPLKIKEESTKLKVVVEDSSQCDRYTGRIIRNIKVGPSSEGVQNFLKTIGQRSVNTIVDATNMTMFDVGQPLHAFDLKKLNGETIFVRNARQDETFETLSGEKLVLKNWMLTIRDEKGPLAIAGVKGGKQAEVDEGTTDIVLEAAHFNPATVRQTARALSLITDSSKRFENEPAPELACEAMDRLTQYILDVAKTDETIVEEVVDVYAGKLEAFKISISVTEVNQLLGTTISKQDIRTIFERFGFVFEESGDVFTVTIPNGRLDLRIKEDVIEEIGRIYGYENIPSIIPAVTTIPPVNKEFYYTTKIRQFFIERGFSEVCTYSFDAIGDVKVTKPLASDKSCVRNSLIPGLKQAHDMNSKHADLLDLSEGLKIFEIGTVFFKDFSEQVMVAIAVSKKAMDYVTELEKEVFDGQKVNGIEEQGVYEFSLSDLLEGLPNPKDDLNLALSKDVKVFKPISPYPYISRDIAVWIGKSDDSQDLLNIIMIHGGTLLAFEPRLVDTFEKDGRISYAYRLVFQSYDRTLSDAEINKIMDEVYSQASKQDGWEVR